MIHALCQQNKRQLLTTNGKEAAFLLAKQRAKFMVLICYYINSAYVLHRVLQTYLVAESKYVENLQFLRFLFCFLGFLIHFFL